MARVSESVCQLSPAAFHAEASSVLAATQGQSRRVISRLAHAHEAPDGFRLFAIYSESSVVGAACYERSRSHLCVVGIITLSAAQRLLSELSAELRSGCARLRGCDGPPMAVQAISSACTVTFGCLVRSDDLLDTMILDVKPRPTAGVPGKLSRVSPQSKLLSILALWFEQFERDTDQVSYSLEGKQRVVSHLSEAASRQEVFTWEVKDKPVAMAILGQLHPKQLLCVYTPAHQRGRGYGQAVTSAVCSEHWQMTGGREPITLSAVDKFGAGRIYERVGFRSTGWLHGVTFVDCNSDTARSIDAFGDVPNVADVYEKASINADADGDTDVGSSTDAETDLENDTEAAGTMCAR